MRKIIISNTLEIDLSNKSISENSENSIFSDVFFSKQTYPFELMITDEIDVALGLISSYNTEKKVFIDCIYVHNNLMNKAILEIIEIKGERASVVLKFGFDEYPSFNKNLSELSLEKKDVTDIYDHAETIITKTWPEVNYNFPMVHTNKYDEDAGISNFQKIINKREQNGFVKNDASYVTSNTVPSDYTAYDRNIIQPLPYHLHILKRGFFDGGHELAGEILNDSLLKKSTIFTSREYFKRRKNETKFTETYRVKDYLVDQPSNALNNENALIIDKTITLPKRGIYKMSGVLTHYPDSYDYIRSSLTVKVTNSNGASTGPTDPFNVHNIQIFPPDSITDNAYEKFFEFEFMLDTLLTINYRHVYFRAHSYQNDERVAINYKIELVNELTNNVFLPNIINENKVDLTKAVPDMTFGEYVTMIKNYLNYDITGIENNVIYMNKVISYLKNSNAKDLSNYEVKRPSRKFEEGNSFLLKFEDIESTEFVYKKVFQDKNGVVNEGYLIDSEKTKTIEINALPLPIVNKSAINTAYSFENEDSKPYFVGYTGISQLGNVALPHDFYLLENIHPIYWNDWFLFRIKAQIFRWQFYKDDIEIEDINIKDIIHAYLNYHLIKTIDKTEVKPGIFSFEIETYS